MDKKEKKSFFVGLKERLFKTKNCIGNGLMSLLSTNRIDDELFEMLEEQLIIADVGTSTSSRLIHSLTEYVTRKQLKDSKVLYGVLKQNMATILKQVDRPLILSTHKPFVILMVGVNGVGKTTTIGKLAKRYQCQGKSVMLAAGDTFRAAAVEQLKMWGELNQISVVGQQGDRHATSVIFDALQAAKTKNIDILIVDTAGRLQNKLYLMDELKRIVRMLKKQGIGAPHEVMLVIDASTGQNAISQVKFFSEAVEVTGITLTKLDGTAKGGIIFGLADQFNIPIRYVGIGEKIDDLRSFNSEAFIEALFSNESVREHPNDPISERK